MSSARSGEHVGTRVVSHVLLALQLVVFLLGGAFAPRGPSHALRDGAAVVAAAGGSDRVAIATSSEPRVDLGTRARALRDGRDSGDGGAGPLHLALDVRSTTLTVAPAALTGTCVTPSASRLPRPPPSVVYGPRGPPQHA